MHCIHRNIRCRMDRSTRVSGKSNETSAAPEMNHAGIGTFFGAAESRAIRRAEESEPNAGSRLCQKCVFVKTVVMSPRVNASPPMLDATSVGVQVLNELATECGVPVPPISASKPIDMMTSCSAFLRNWYLGPISRFPNPVCGLSPAGSILLVPISTPSQGVTSFFPAA